MRRRFLVERTARSVRVAPAPGLARAALVALLSGWALYGPPPLGLRAAHALGVRDIFREPRIEGTRVQSAVLSPDEKWVAFAWNPDGWQHPLNLYVASAPGGELRALTSFERDAGEDSLRRQWQQLRQTIGRGTSDSLEALPRYFQDESKRHRVGDIAWSRDSRHIAFVDRGDLYVVRLSDAEVDRLTHTHAKEGEPRWSPDGRFLAFQRDGSVWLLQMGRSREVQLTKPAGSGASLSNLSWSPDGSKIAFMLQNDQGRGDLVVPNYLPERVVNEPVKEGYPNVGVRIVDLEPILDPHDPQAIYRDDTFETVDVQLGEGKHPWIAIFAWSPDGRHLAVSETLPDMRTRRIHVANPDSGGVRTVYTEVDSAWIEEYDWVVTDLPVLDWSPDGRWLLFTTERTGWNHLVRLDVDGGEPEQLTDGDWEVAWARWLPQGRHVMLLTSREDLSQRHLEILDLESRRLERLQTAPGMNTHPALGERGGIILYRHSRFSQPPDLWTIRTRPGEAPKRITATVPERFRAVDWSVPEIVHFTARDGTPLRGLLYRPDDFDPRHRYPVVVFAHGAGSMQNVVDGWTIYSPNYKFHTVLTQKGFVVFEVDYRGSLGYGHDFRAGTFMHIGGKDLDDELAGVDYLKALDFVDASRIGIYGGSYGGFMALMALFLAPDEYACGAALRFVSDWENYYRGNPGYCIQRLGRPKEHPAAYYRSSPIHFAENLEDPLLLLHGVRDDNVHFQDAAQLVERLIRLGKQFELMIYPAERHGFTEPESWIDEYARIEEFFVRHLKPGSRSEASVPAGASSRE